MLVPGDRAKPTELLRTLAWGRLAGAVCDGAGLPGVLDLVAKALRRVRGEVLAWCTSTWSSGANAHPLADVQRKCHA